jgi:hypothetical protein
MRSHLGAFVLASFALLSSTAHAETKARPLSLVIPQPVTEGALTPAGTVPYNTIFLNRCAGTGCVVRPGGSNSVNDTWGIPSQKTLTPFPYGDQAWNDVVACVKDVMSPFVINVTDVDPGSAKHFEIMVAGKGTDLYSGWTNVGGIAPGSCSAYVDNGLVFAFAKSYGDNTNNTCDASCVNELCATAAQEIGHIWRGMDHVRVSSDPMTYNSFNDRRYYQDGESQCGSDCVNGVSPAGYSCTGTNNQSHQCNCTGLQTQNSHSIVAGLFGLGPGSPPVTKITAPKLGANVDPGFSVYTDITDDSGKISKVVFKVDNVEVMTYDPHQTPGSATVDVVIGPPCKSESDCSKDTDVCVGGRCVPGSGVNGGLGTTCGQSTDCLSNRCASDGTNMYCVEQCMVGQCPPDYGCLDVGDGTSVCWPGYDDGSGGCGCQSSKGGPLGMVLAMLCMVLMCRKRRR